jgi:hypothetical protein
LKRGERNMASVDNRIVVTTAARRMLEQAKERARRLGLVDPARGFYSGVETAALHALHPAAEEVRAAHRGWLGHESVEFQDGYLKAMAALGTSETAARPLLRVPLPQP